MKIEPSIIQSELDWLKSRSKSAIERERLFDEWQCRATISAKRISATLAIVLATASFADIPVQSLPLFGTRAESGDPMKFAWALVAILFVSTCAFLSGFWIDWGKRRLARKALQQAIDQVHSRVKKVCDYVGMNARKTAEALSTESKNGQLRFSPEAYQMFVFIHEQKRNVRFRLATRVTMEFAELALIVILGIYGASSIIISTAAGA